MGDLRGAADPVDPDSLTGRLLAVARELAPRVWQWSGGEWRCITGRPEAIGDTVAIIEARHVGDAQPLDTLTDVAPGARLFVLGGGTPSDAVGLAEAAAWSAGREGRVISIDDRAGRWTALAPGRPVRGGSIVGFLGRPPLVLAAVVHLGDLGGASRAHLELATELVDRGHLVHTLTPSWSSRSLTHELRAAGVSTSTHSCQWWVGVGEDPDPADAGIGVTELVAELGSIRPDLVLTETAVLPGGALAARELGIPHVWMIHERVDPDYGLRLPGPPEELGRVIRSLSDAVLVNSHFVARHFFGGVPPDAVVAPISVAEFDRISCTTREGVVAEPGDRPFTVAVVGQILPAKGQLEVLGAMKRLVEGGRQVRLRVFGWGSQEAVDQLRSTIRMSGLVDSVVLEGHRRDIAEQLAACDAVAIMSWAEGFSRVAVEAVAAGVPVVYAESGGITEYMSDGVTGLAVQLGDSEAMAGALARLMDDSQLRRSLAAEATDPVRSWLQAHSAPDAVEHVAETARRSMADSGWGQRLVSGMMLRGAQDLVGRTEALDSWMGAELSAPAAIQGARLRGERMARLLSQWVGRRGTRRSLLPRGAAATAGVLGSPLPRRVRVALLVAAVDPAMDSLVVERLVDQDWYRSEYGVAPDRDAVVEFARVGLRAGHRPNEYVDPAWYRSTYPDVAESGVPEVQHYFSDGCFEGRVPGPLFDPDGYLRSNPDVAGSQLLPLEHYILFGRAEGRTW